MTTQLQKLTSLIRHSEKAVLMDHVLRLTCLVNQQILADAKIISETKSIRIYQNGTELFKEFDDLPIGSEIDFFVSGTQSSTAHVSQNLDDFLAYQDGIFLSSSRPQEWYLIDEDYLSGEPIKSPLVDAYVRLPALLAFFRDVFDFVAPKGTREVLVVLAGKKSEIPIFYKASDLSRYPSDSSIENVRDDILHAPQIAAKKELFKRSVVRFLEGVEMEARFIALFSGLEVITRSYEADRDNFFSEFEFEKLAEQFERKRQEFMLKVDAVCGDLLTKVLAVPIGQAIVVSQYKDTGGALGNVSLLVGSALFTLIGIAFVLNQVHSIKEIRSNATREKREIENKYPLLHGRVSTTYTAVLTRVNWYGRALPVLVTVLLFAGFFVSLAGFDRVAPCNGCIESAAISLVKPLP